MQHLHEKRGKLDDIVTGTGGETRPCNTNELLVFSHSEPAFSVVSLKTVSIKVSFVGTSSNIIYSDKRSYR